MKHTITKSDVDKFNINMRGIGKSNNTIQKYNHDIREFKNYHCSLIKICCPFLVKSVTIYMVFTKVPDANLAGVAPEPFLFS